MSLNKMGFNTANKIVAFYSSLLSNLENKKIHEKYGYSELNRYDSVDISNAMKLMIAYRYFYLKTNDTEKSHKLEEYIAAAKTSLYCFSDSFYPDDIIVELNQINTTDSRLRDLRQIELTNDSDSFEMNKLLYLQETPDEFFKYCMIIGKDNPYFWENVYHRLGLTWETNDEEDRIYILIKHKDFFNQKGNAVNNPVASTSTDNTHNKKNNLIQLLKERLFPIKK